MNTTRAKEIVDFARDVRENWGDDPFDIADMLGIKMIFGYSLRPEACILKLEGYPMMMRINGCHTEIARKVMCVHELGHAFLHEENLSRFSGTEKSIIDDSELEANLFAVAFLFDKDDFSIPIENMSNFMLKSILDYNIS